MLLQRPNEDAPASRLADWLELLAMSEQKRAFGGGELRKIIRIEGEERNNRLQFNYVSDQIEEGEITEVENGEIIADVFKEIGRRARALGVCYPFKLETIRSGVIERQRLQWKDSALEIPGAVVYACCLVVSAYRLNLLEEKAEDESRKTESGHLFYSEYMLGLIIQICAAIALGGYLKGVVVSFGYPRPDGSGFLAAHIKTWRRFGAYRTVTEVPLGAPDRENDGGIDLIGWLNFPDGHASKILVFGQVASGANWVEKSVLDCAYALKNWFSSPAFEHFLPAMVMPFNITDARKTISRGPVDMRAAVLELEERQFGIVLDRERVATCADAAMAADPALKKNIDCIVSFDTIANWIRGAINHMAKK